MNDDKKTTSYFMIKMTQEEFEDMKTMKKDKSKKTSPYVMKTMKRHPNATS